MAAPVSKFLELKSPVGAEPIRYEWPLLQTLNRTVSFTHLLTYRFISNHDHHFIPLQSDVANEIIETIINVCYEIQELNVAIQNYFAENDCNTNRWGKLSSILFLILFKMIYNLTLHHLVAAGFWLSGSLLMIIELNKADIDLYFYSFFRLSSPLNDFPHLHDFHLLATLS